MFRDKSAATVNLICCLALAIPILSANYVPLVDMPQHLHQVMLFFRELGASDSPYKIQWLAPYNLAHTILGFMYALFPPLLAARLTMLAIGALWIVAISRLATVQNRPLAGATLACIFFFNNFVYWGFMSFALGLPLFIFWYLLLQRPGSAFWKDAALALALALALYLAHLLWFAAALCWLPVQGILFRVRRTTRNAEIVDAPRLSGQAAKSASAFGPGQTQERALLARALGALPALLIAVVWFLQSPRNLDLAFNFEPHKRIFSAWFVDAALGGLHGALEGLLLAFVLLWCGIGLIRCRRNLARSIDFELLVVSIIFLGGAILLPSFSYPAIQFAERWAPPAMIFLVLAMPEPFPAPRVLRLAATAIFVAFCCYTAFVWKVAEREEFTGLEETLRELPREKRVLGLDLVRFSRYVKGRPFIQAFSWSGTMRGSELNFSFAELYPVLVVHKRPRAILWSRGLEWDARRALLSDLKHFDYVIINGQEQDHVLYAGYPQLAPVTKRGRFRLYKIQGTDFPACLMNELFGLPGLGGRPELPMQFANPMRCFR